MILSTVANLFIALSLAIHADAAPIQWTAPARIDAGAKAPLELRDGTVLVAHTRSKGNRTSIDAMRRDPASGKWTALGRIAEAPSPIDMGDGHMIQLADGRLLYVYRFNRTAGAFERNRDYQIRAAVSADAGKTWNEHSTVAFTTGGAAGAPGKSHHGLWAPSLLQLADGSILCFYDDEDIAHRNGLPWSQWIVARRWSDTKAAWSEPIVVTRNERDCRDGMPSAVQLPAGRIVVTFEAPELPAPDSVILRSVHSDDNGETWSWPTRAIVHNPSVKGALCVSPWLVSLGGDDLICVFATDEDRAERTPPGTPPGNMRNDLKCVLSDDGGETWSPAQMIYRASRSTYLPGAIQLRHGNDAGKLLLLTVDRELGPVELLGALPASR